MHRRDKKISNIKIQEKVYENEKLNETSDSSDSPESTEIKSDSSKNDVKQAYGNFMIKMNWNKRKSNVKKGSKPNEIDTLIPKDQNVTRGAEIVVEK